jgi:hypothetical protein
LDSGVETWVGHEPVGALQVDVEVAGVTVDLGPLLAKAPACDARVKSGLRGLGSSMSLAALLVALHADIGLRFLALQLAAFITAAMEGSPEKLQLVTAREAMSIVKKYQRTEHTVDALVAQDVTNGAVRNARQAARTLSSLGHMQVAQYAVATERKLVKYWLAGLRFFREVGSLAVSADQSRVGQRNLLMAFVVGRRHGAIRAMWLMPQALRVDIIIYPQPS